MNWIDSLFGKQEISKEAHVVPVGTNAEDTADRKIKASDWMLDVAKIDADQVDKEYNDTLAAEAKMLGKTAAYESFQTTEDTLKHDYAKSVKILSDYALSEMLMEIRGHKEQNLPEMYVEHKEKAKRDVASSREKCEKEVLEHVGMSAQTDWKKAFEKYTKEAKPEEPKEKDLFQPKLDKIDEKEWSEGKKNDKDFIISDKEKTTQAGAGNGREQDERQDVTKQPGEPQEKKASLKVDAFLVRDPDELNIGNKITLVRSVMAMNGSILSAGGDYEITGREGERFVLTANGKSYEIARFDTPKFFVTAELQTEVNKEAASNMEVINAFVSDSFPKHKGAGVGSANLHVVRYPHGWALVNYSTPIAYRPNGGELFLNTDKYSTTTSAIQNAIRQASGGATKEIDESGLMSAIGDASLAAQASLKVKADPVKDSPVDSKVNIALPEGKETAGDKPEEAVKGTTLPADKKEVGDKADRAEEKNSYDKGEKVEEIEAVNKKAHNGTDHVAEMCPVCGGPGRDLGSLGQRDHMKCESCGIMFSHENKEASCGHCSSLNNEIKNQATKEDVLKIIKQAEVQSPWRVIQDENGNDVIARIEQPTNKKESEEDLEKELQK